MLCTKMTTNYKMVASDLLLSIQLLCKMLDEKENSNKIVVFSPDCLCIYYEHNRTPRCSQEVSAAGLSWLKNCRVQCYT